MYLKSLTLRGFKSFASATTLNFEPGITAIVGPNGSGKSNIVDALAWVMGEQGAKTLRGGKMDDVIFAGTSGRAPLGRAEVTLTIDNTDGTLPIDYTEVTISRTLFRAGGSEYAINSQSARLLDVQELLSDTGMGREMHVIVGQGQLDAILAATPEIRRTFIEEAAGVLKHRRRKDKAVRKLDATQANLERLGDLISEIRRQLKPLGRQAEVARKAAVVQTELRDARARLLADELSQATQALASDLESEASLAEQRRLAEIGLDAAREAEANAEQKVASASSALSVAQDLWYGLSTLRERVTTTLSISAERMRHGEVTPAIQQGRDPDQLEREAADVRAEENTLRQQVQVAGEALSVATQHRNDCENAHAEAERRYNEALRVIADRREGLAKLTGAVNSLHSRVQAQIEEVERLGVRRGEAVARAERAEHEYTVLETQITGLSDGEFGLDAEFEAAAEALKTAQAQGEQLRTEQADLNQRRAGLSARVEALELSLERKDAEAALLSRDDVYGLLGAASSLVKVESGFEAAIAAALGQAANALAVAGLSDAVAAFDVLKRADLGRARLLVADAVSAKLPTVDLPAGARAAMSVVSAEPGVQAALSHLLGSVVIVDDLDVAARLVESAPQLTAVTRQGDLLSAWFAAGGSTAQPSLLEMQAAAKAAKKELDAVCHNLERLRFAVGEQQTIVATAQQAHDRALAKLNESDARMSGLAEQLANLSQTARNARGEVARLDQAIETSRANRGGDEDKLQGLQERLDLASQDSDIAEPDPTVRDELSDQARLARQAEMEARLALRTAEERANAMAGRADALTRAAAHERASRARALQRAEQLRREAEAARSVHQAAIWLAAQVDTAVGEASVQRQNAETARVAGEQALSTARAAVRERSAGLDALVQGAHRDEMARVELQMRIESVTERALNELGLDANTLLGEYGPDQLVPVVTRPDGSALTDADETPEPVPYVREEQQRRLRKAQQNLELLGRVNPLALEEFDAMSERHAFLAEQVDDLKKTRADLLGIIAEVDSRVQEVFTQAYADVAKTFTEVFARLFPGGEGRLVLTDPTDLLNTGVEVEARPAGKKVKRLSLLSGGERSLVAVAFLISLFIARPSPFYILDEVEAALDDTNLGRLLEIYEDLRKNSQLLVITHQKRSMEVADALYGITMRGDGVSRVISQRLHDR